MLVEVILVLGDITDMGTITTMSNSGNMVTVVILLQLVVLLVVLLQHSFYSAPGPFPV